MTIDRSRWNTGRGLALGALLLMGTACQDLFVQNNIEPDRDRALGNPSDVEAFIGAAFYPSFFRPVTGTDGGLSGLTVFSFQYAAPDISSTMSGPITAVWHLDHIEPRRELNNNPTICSTICEWGPRDYWGRISNAASIPYDGLQILDGEIEIVDAQGRDLKPRARAFAKFMQAWTWGYTFLMFDRAHIIPETVDLPGTLEELQEYSRTSLMPYDEAIDHAVQSLMDAVAIAQANPDVVHFPVEDASQSIPWFASPTPITNAQFIQMANTLAARLLVLNARNPAERAAVDWQKVLQLTANGIQPGNDYLVQLNADRTSNLLALLQRNDVGFTYHTRWNYYTIGMADQSGGYQDWLATPIDDRNRFDIVTPDRRITGDTPTSNGSYTCYRPDNNGFLAERGTHRFSAYQWARHKFANGISCEAEGVTASNAGTQRMITADENALLRAEALLRTGDLEGAAAMINVTRTREHLGQSLPPVTADGVPMVDGECVPRTDSGECGTLMTALRYERFIELLGTDAIRSYADARGFGMLPDGSLEHFPVPGNILDQYGLPLYTYGGIGGNASATYAPAN